MAFQPSVDSFGIRRLGFKCSWWHPRQANDAVVSEPAFLAKITIIKVFSVSRWTGTYLYFVVENYEHTRTTQTHMGQLQ